VVGKAVSDSKRQVEDSHDWDAFGTTKTVTTVANQGSGYCIVGSGLRFKTETVINSTYFSTLDPMSRAEVSIMRQMGTAQTSAPSNYIFLGVDSNGDMKVDFWPTPDRAYTINFNLIIPSAPLVANTDVIYVPAEPVVLGALARSLVERGEDGGLTSSEAFALYKSSLSDHIALEASRSPELDTWEPT
jgi:hypothetical protein